jgi:hypothetical protein
VYLTCQLLVATLRQSAGDSLFDSLPAAETGPRTSTSPLRFDLGWQLPDRVELHRQRTNNPLPIGLTLCVIPRSQWGLNSLPWRSSLT